MSHIESRRTAARHSPLCALSIAGAAVLAAVCLTPLAAWGQGNSPPEPMPAMDKVPVADRPAGGDPAPAADASSTDAVSKTAVQTAIPTNLFDIIRAGGPLMIPIGACSVIAVLFGIERLIVLRRRRVIPRDFVVRFIDLLQNNELDRGSALELCEQNGSPVASIFAHAVRKWGKPSVEVEQAVIDGGERQVSHLRKHLRILNAVSTISPLLGLLGTVIGMIICFNQIASTSAMGKAEQLAGGIGVALITTAGGLCVAIPALILYMYFVGRVDSLVMEMDHLAQKVVNLISAESLGSASLQPGSPVRSTASTPPKVRPPTTSVVEPKEPIRR